MALRAKKYFQDFETETCLEDGRPVRRTVYKGDLYRRELSAAARTKERMLYIPAALLSGLLLLAAMTRETPANVDGLCAAFSLLAMIPAFCTLEGAVEAFFRRGDLRKNDYQERLLMLRVMPVAGAALNALIAALYLAHGAQQAAYRGADWPAAGCTALAAALHAAIALREIRVKYRVIPSERSRGAAPARRETSNEE